MASWQEVRVFISSTFRDMHAERDWLVKRVFPRLRARLEPYRIRLIDIDLRWGITEDEQKNDRVLDLCLEQIDTCRPFFVGILGERYGWVPTAFDEESVSKYGWIQNVTGKSVTELEILYGVLRNPDMFTHSFFYFRDSAFVEDVPEAKRSDLEAEDVESAEKLSRLKQTIRDANLPAPPFESYPCSYAGLRINWRLASMLLNDTDRDALHTVAADGIIDPQEYAALDDRLAEFVHEHGAVDLADLEAFGDRVFDNLWAGIKAEHELPDTPPMEMLRDTDPLAEEDGLHRQFMETRTQIYIGRQEIQNQLHAIADHDDSLGCVVTGPAGSGKSAVMAKFAQDYAAKHDDQLVIAHFVGASPGSTSLRQMLRRFCLILQNEFSLEGDIPFDTNELVTKFREFVRAVPKDKRIVIVIDALNQLGETDRAHDLNWLPREWPDNVKCFVSCISRDGEGEALGGPSSTLAESPGETSQIGTWPSQSETNDTTISPAEPNKVLEAFKGRRNYKVSVDALTDEERFAIITEIPSVSAKRLSPDQVARLMKNSATQNPLFLLVALEELRGFGSFELLDRRIDQLPDKGDTVTAIFTQVIERLEEDFDGDAVRSILSWLACARSGLSEQELLELLEGIGTTESHGDLFPILRQLRPYLQPRGEFLDFYHRSLYRAARAKYFEREGEAPAEPQTGLAKSTGTSGQGGTWPSPSESIDTTSPPPSLRGSSATAAISTVETTTHSQLADYFHTKTNPENTAPFSGDHPHAISELVYHQVEAGRRDEAEKTLTTYAFLQARVDAFGPQPLIDDYDLLTLDRNSPLDLIRGAIRLSSNVLIADPVQLTSQLHARMIEFNREEITNLLHDAAVSQTEPWLRSFVLCASAPDGPLLRTMDGHGSGVSSVVVTPDGTQILAGSRDGTLRLWDLITGEELRTLHGHMDWVTSVTVSPDGSRAVAASMDTAIRIFELATGDVLHTLRGHEGAVQSVAITPDGTWLISGSRDCSLKIWDMETGVELQTLNAHRSAINSVVITPDGALAVSASEDWTLKVWDLVLDVGDELWTLEGHRNWVFSVAVTPDGAKVVSASRDCTLKVWDLNEGIELQTLIGHTHSVYSTAITPDGTFTISASRDKTIKVWDTASGIELTTMVGHVDEVNSVAITPDGTRICSASMDGTLKMWDLRTKVEEFSLRGHSDRINSVAITPDGTMAITASSDHSLKVWGLGTGEELHTLCGHEGEVESVGVTPDGAELVSASRDGTIKKWVLATGEELRTLRAHTIWGESAAITPNGTLAVSGSHDDLIYVHDLATGQELSVWHGHKGLVESIAVTPNRAQMVSASFDRIKIWNIDTDVELHIEIAQDELITFVVITPDGTRAFSGSSDGTIKMWDLATGEERRVLRGHTGNVNSVAVSLDENLAVSASEDKTLRVWEVETGRCLTTLLCETRLIACTFSPDCRTVVSGGEGGIVYFLRLEGFDQDVFGNH